MPNIIPENINWTLPEYEHREKTNDWYWALAVVIICGSIASIIYENYLFAALLVIAGILMGHFASQPPEMINFEVNNKGFKLKAHTYPYKKIKSFFVGGEKDLYLFIKIDRLFLPIIYVPIEKHLAEMIRAKLLSQNVVEEEMKEHPSEKIMEIIGF
ncbi:MAG: hypothetical protein KBC12_00595 [Candidatus Pacebacteria bacterium]|nr:hypothetical protein [Candidatus Paceibacterota bacterium]MBP9851150.1 hypothetical protein [Candidatus Paceibacterota bacterium]